MRLLSEIKVSCSPANDLQPSVLYLLVELESPPHPPPLPPSSCLVPLLLLLSTFARASPPSPAPPRLSRWLSITSKGKVCRATDNDGLDPQSTSRLFQSRFSLPRPKGSATSAFRCKLPLTLGLLVLTFLGGVVPLCYFLLQFPVFWWKPVV